MYLTPGYVHVSKYVGLLPPGGPRSRSGRDSMSGHNSQQDHQNLVFGQVTMMRAYPCQNTFGGAPHTTEISRMVVGYLSKPGKSEWVVTGK